MQWPLSLPSSYTINNDSGGEETHVCSSLGPSYKLNVPHPALALHPHSSAKLGEERKDVVCPCQPPAVPNRPWSPAWLHSRAGASFCGPGVVVEQVLASTIPMFRKKYKKLETAPFPRAGKHPPSS